MKRVLWIVCLLLLLGVLPLPLALAQAGGPVDPYESGVADEDFDDAYGPLTLGPQYAAYFTSPYDRDFYYFEMGEVGTIWIELANVPENYTYGLILYDKNKEIASLDVQGKGDKRLRFDMSFKGRYYLMVDVRVGGYDPHIPYLLRVTTSQAGGEEEEVTDSYEENNTYGTAYGPLASGETYRAYCWSQGDRDCYYFTVSNPTNNVHLELEKVCAACDYELYLVNADEEIVAASENGQGMGESLSANVPAGRYYIVVHPYRGYSTSEPYLLTAVFEGREQPTGPQPGQEGAWAREEIEALGYTVVYDPGVMDGTNNTRIGLAVELPRSMDLRLEDDTTWEQAASTWQVLIQAFDVHTLAIGLVYQDRYMVYYAVASGDWGRYMAGDLSREDLPYSYGVFDLDTGEWLQNAKDFIDKNLQ